MREGCDPRWSPARKALRMTLHTTSSPAITAAPAQRILRPTGFTRISRCHGRSAQHCQCPAPSTVPPTKLAMRRPLKARRPGLVKSVVTGRRLPFTPPRQADTTQISALHQLARRAQGLYQHFHGPTAPSSLADLACHWHSHGTVPRQVIAPMSSSRAPSVPALLKHRSPPTRGSKVAICS